MRKLIDSLVACGTRISIGNWDDPKRGPGCGRDKIVERLNEINKANGQKCNGHVEGFLNFRRYRVHRCDPLFPSAGRPVKGTS